MHGNVSEWLQDLYLDDYYSSSPTTDPQGPASGWNRVIRDWGLNSASHVRSSMRSSSEPAHKSSSRGFRLVKQAQ